MNWQDTIALLLVAIAAGYIAWRVVGLIRRRGGSCGSGGGCGSCSAQETLPEGAKPLVELELPERTAK